MYRVLGIYWCGHWVATLGLKKFKVTLCVNTGTTLVVYELGQKNWFRTQGYTWGVPGVLPQVGLTEKRAPDKSFPLILGTQNFKGHFPVTRVCGLGGLISWDCLAGDTIGTQRRNFHLLNRSCKNRFFRGLAQAVFLNSMGFPPLKRFWEPRGEPGRKTQKHGPFPLEKPTTGPLDNL